MGIFGRKPPAPPAPEEPSGQGPLEFSPDKAKRFFDYARTVHDATNYEYAMVNWLNGIRQDPGTVDGLTGFFNSAGGYVGDAPKKSASRDMAKAAGGGKGPLDRYLAALLDWGCNPFDVGYGVRATKVAADLGLEKPAVMLGERALRIAPKDKRARKGDFLTLMEIFQKFNSFDNAVIAGHKAVELDNTDNQLAADLRNLQARATMVRGGFEQTGEVGGFRSNLRDAEKQRRLEEEERVVKTEETLDRLVELAKADYESRPTDKPAIRKYAERLLERGTPEDEEVAHKVLMSAHELTQEFAFREAAGKIRLRRAKRRLNKMEAAAHEAGGSGPAQEAFEKGRQEFLQLEMQELKLRSEAYPTDLALKFELGKRCFDLGRYDEAIELFQEAKTDVKNRARVMNALGQSFYRIEFYDGAVETYRQLLEHAGGLDGEMGMEVKYGLMLALQGRAQENSDLADAEEAYKLASQIAIQQFTYRDVKTKREELKGLVAKLKG